MLLMTQFVLDLLLIYDLQKMSVERMVTKNTQLKIILVSSHRVFSGGGGVEEFTKLLGKELIKRNHKPILIYKHSFPRLTGISKSFSTEHSSINRLKTIPKASFSIYLLSMIFFSIIVFIKLLRLVNKENADLIHAQDPVFAGLPSNLVSRITGVPLIVHCHGSIPQPHRQKKTSVSWAIERLFYLGSFLNQATFMVTDDVTAEYLFEDGLDPKNCVIQPAFVDSHFFVERESITDNKKYHHLCLGYVGRLVDVKRVDLLIEAVSYLRKMGIEINATIVGDGELKEDLIAFSENLGVRENISFVGWVSNVKDYLESIDIFVLASESEGSPISLLEAMAVGKPCIVSNLRSLRNLTGIDCVRFFRKGDSMHLAKIIYELNNRPSLLRNMSLSAKLRAENFQLDKVVDNILEEYTKRIRK